MISDLSTELVIIFLLLLGNGLFTAVVNRDFPTAAELTNIGNASKTGLRSNNGTMWA